MPDPGRVDRSAFSITTFEEAEAEDRRFWWSQTPEARLQAVQYLREVSYGDAATARLQRVGCAGLTALEFAERDGR